MLDLLTTPRRRRLLFSLLYLSEGAPIGFIWWALPTHLRTAGVPITEITWLTSLLILPWTFKFLWSPLVDTLQSKRWTLKQWIIAAQLAMGLALLPACWLDPQEDFRLLAVALLVHAVTAATQDVAIDALCIRVTEPAERGRLNGWMQSAMLLGRAGLGGGALLLATWLGEAGVVLLLIGIVWSSMFVLLLTRLPDAAIGQATESETLRKSLAAAATAARQKSTWLAIAFALIGGAAFEGLGVIAGPLLIDRGFTRGEVGYLYALPLVACTIAGSLAGGRLADRLGHRKAAALALVWIVASAACAGLAASERLSHTQATAQSLLVIALAAVYFGIGLFTASSYAMFMDLTTPGIAATQFSALMGATNGCEAWSGYAIGRLVAARGYDTAIWLMCVPSLLAIALLAGLRREPRDEKV